MKNKETVDWLLLRLNFTSNLGLMHGKMGDRDPIFHRTQIINNMICNVKTPIVAVWDSDVITINSQIIESIEALRNGVADLVFPYSGKLLETSKTIRELFYKYNSIRYLIKHQNKMMPLYGPTAVGGGFFVNLACYKEIGLENEHFYGWGHEDGERILRFIKLHKRIYRVNGVMFHLTHARGINSTYHEPSQKEIKLNEAQRIEKMTKEELLAEIDMWKINTKEII